MKKELYLDDKLFKGAEEEFLAIEKFKVKTWKLNGKEHRKDGPAEIYPDGHKVWYQNGRFHRIDGPAVIWSDRGKSWYVNNISLNWINNWFPMSYWICGDDI